MTNWHRRRVEAAARALAGDDAQPLDLDRAEAAIRAADQAGYGVVPREEYERLAIDYSAMKVRALQGEGACSSGRSRCSTESPRARPKTRPSRPSSRSARLSSCARASRRTGTPSNTNITMLVMDQRDRPVGALCEACRNGRRLLRKRIDIATNGAALASSARGRANVGPCTDIASTYVVRTPRWLGPSARWRTPAGCRSARASRVAGSGPPKTGSSKSQISVAGIRPS